jgi:outer membrane protein assembly factor BamB
MNAVALAAFSIFASGTTVLASDWPHWRGPTRDGVSAETGLPVEWSTSKNVRWKIPMPDRSGSTPILSSETIFLNVAEAGALHLWALDRKDGSLRWKAFLSGGDHRERKQNMSSPSPLTDGKSVWVMTGTGILKAFDFAGKELWSRDIQKDYGRFGLNWGYASSPLLHAGALYVQVLHGMKTDDPSYLLRIDASSGETVWRVERPTKAIRESPDSYTTPALLEHEGRNEIVVTGGDVVTGHDLDTGAELWRSDGLNPENDPNYRIVASPVVKDGIIYAPTRVKPLLALKAGGRGDVTATHRLWEFDRGPDVPTPVTDGKRLYIVDDQGILFCLDAKTGASIWGPKRIAPGIYSSSPVLADGKIYATSEDGITTVLRAGDAFEVLAENHLEGYTLSSPAISRGEIFMRTDNALYCIRNP